MTKRTRGDKKSGSIDYPVSTNYRSEWGQWEAVREIVQNAIDSGGASVKPNGSRLSINDTGKGIALKHLLIGESTKDGISSIGKFGEGMKFAFLALLRDGCGVRVRTNGLILTPKLKDMFGEDCLTIKYQPAKVAQNGTSVQITHLADPHYLLTNFLGYTLKANTAERVLHDRPGELFIKGIFVKHIRSSVGYNLDMERENPISGAVDMDKVSDRVAGIIANTNDRPFMRTLIEDHFNDNKDTVEAQAGAAKYWRMKHPVMWKQEAKEVCGSNQICRASNVDMARSAQYKGFVVLFDSAPFFEGFIKEDVDVIATKRLEEQTVSIEDLDGSARANVRWCRRMIENAMDKKIKAVRIVRFTGEDAGTLGAAKYRSYIKIAPGITRDRETCLETFLHEATHYYYGSTDLTHDFQQDHDRLTAKVIMSIASGGAPRKTKERAPVDHARIKADWLHIYESQCLSIKPSKSKSTVKMVEIHGEIERHLGAVRMMADLYSVAKSFNVKNYSGQTKANVVSLIAVSITAEYMSNN